MKVKSKTSNPGKHTVISQFFQRTVLMLFGFLFIGQAAVGLAKNPSNELNLGRFLTGFDSIQHAKSFDLFQHLPFNSESQLPESLGETEVEEYIDDDLSGGHFSTSLQVSIHRSGIGRCASDFLKSLQNRKAIPLFVLHHCWRTFLS